MDKQITNEEGIIQTNKAKENKTKTVANTVGIKYAKVLFHLFTYIFSYKIYIESLPCVDFVQDVGGNKVNETGQFMFS